MSSEVLDIEYHWLNAYALKRVVKGPLTITQLLSAFEDVLHMRAVSCFPRAIATDLRLANVMMDINDIQSIKYHHERYAAQYASLSVAVLVTDPRLTAFCLAALARLGSALIAEIFSTQEAAEKWVLHQAQLNAELNPLG